MSGATAPSAIRIEDLTVAYDRIPAVHHLNGSFAPGSLTAIAGPNGAGKSTLLKTLVGILKPDQGRVVVSGGTAVGYLPQRSEIERSFPIRVWDMTALGLWPENGVVSAIGKDQVARIADALRAVGLENMARRPIGTLSAGQFQRMLFARLLVQDPQIILLDEPFSALDERTSGDLLAVIERWHRQGRTIIAVLHEMEQIQTHFPQCLLMAREPVAWGPTGAVLTPENLMRARHLSQAWHDDDAEAAPTKTLAAGERSHEHP